MQCSTIGFFRVAFLRFILIAYSLEVYAAQKHVQTSEKILTYLLDPLNDQSPHDQDPSHSTEDQLEARHAAASPNHINPLSHSAFEPEVFPSE